MITVSKEWFECLSMNTMIKENEDMKLNKAEVLSDKQNEPTEKSIKMFIGEDACERLSKIEELLNNL